MRTFLGVWALVLALLFLLMGAYPVAAFLGFTAGMLALFAPTDEQRDARRRNDQAHR